MSYLPRALPLTLGLSLLLGSGLLGPGRALHAQGAESDDAAPRTRFGFGSGIALSTSPLGEIAERHGTYGIPGHQYEVRLFARTPERGEWSVALLWDDYHVGQQLDLATKYRFDYSSTSLVVGWQSVPDREGLPLVYGLDAGWLRYVTEANSIDYYTSTPYDSRTVGHAAVLGWTAGLEIAGGVMTTVPRIRLEMNFPDFGGGDGYSRLHPETDLGFKASFGFVLKFAGRS
jgi:hypothetical protein